MEENIISLLGGRMAEELIIGDISTGASNDIERATSIARSMVTKYGMSDVVGAIMFGSGQEEVFLGRDFTQHKDISEQTAEVIDAEVKNIIDTAYQRAVNILSQNMSKLHDVANVLIEKEKIDGEEFEEIMNR
jgi:cell division protease FtsH